MNQSPPTPKRIFVCPDCASKLAPFHMNFQDVIFLCSNKECLFPLNSGNLLDYIFPASSVKVTPRKRELPIILPPHFQYMQDPTLSNNANLDNSLSPLDELDNLLNGSEDDMIRNNTGEELEINNSSDLMDVIDSLTT